MAKDFDAQRVQAMTRPAGMKFTITKIGHVVLHCRDLERTVKFYTEVLGFKVSDVYPNDMVPGGMVFMRCAADHHGVGFVGCLEGESKNIELNHLAFEVATLDEVLHARATISRRTASPSISRAAAAPARRSPSSSTTPTATGSRFSGASTGSAPTGASAPPRNGNGRTRSRTRLPIRARTRTRRWATPRSCASAAPTKSAATSNTRSRPRPPSSARREGAVERILRLTCPDTCAR